MINGKHTVDDVLLLIRSLLDGKKVDVAELINDVTEENDDNNRQIILTLDNATGKQVFVISQNGIEETDPPEDAYQAVFLPEVKYMTVSRVWEILNMTTGEKLELPPGKYAIERIPHPEYNCNWLVLFGTKNGASEDSWRQWEDSSNHYKVVIE